MGMRERLPNSHGAIGKIIKTEIPYIIVQDDSQIEKIISLKEDTKILRGNRGISPAELSVNNFVVVIGNPDEER
jgi:hypothetical protein